MESAAGKEQDDLHELCDKAQSDQVLLVRVKGGHDAQRNWGSGARE